MAGASRMGDRSRVAWMRARFAPRASSLGSTGRAPRRRRLLPMAAAVCLTLVACSSGKQTLGWESASDTYLPWPGGSSYYTRWAHGPPADASFFPILVWMQSPPNAARFRDVGVNFFTGLWQGPTEDQLTGLRSADMPAACEQSGVWEAHLGDPTIRGWLQQDQPDDAQQKPDGTYAGCVPPSAVRASYESMVAKDPTRPVFMNLGRVVAKADWVGRGSRAGQSGCDA